MIKTCGNCQFILYDDEGGTPYCAIQDLRKAIWYIERLIQHYEMQEQSNG